MIMKDCVQLNPHLENILPRVGLEVKRRKRSMIEQVLKSVHIYDYSFAQMMSFEE